jgi:hypothetical protein
VQSDPEAYDRFYNIFANPMLWFIQHYLWDLSNAPDIRRHEVEAFEFGYNVVNEDLAAAVLAEIEGAEEPVVMVHDYHLYTLPAMVRRQRPDAFLHHFIHIPWTQSDAWKVLPNHIREEIYTGILANDIIGLHTKQYRRNFLQCCVDLMGLEVDHERGVVHYEDREIWVRAYPLPIDWRATQALARRRRVADFEERLLRRRREYSILRVDRADLSKNVLRGFTAFDIFLEQHPEFHERITFTAQLMPSRTDVPEYAEYLERIEALVAVVNHRHGTPDWMPIDLKLRDDLEEAVASASQRARRRLDPVGEHGRARGARRVVAVGEPVRRAGARRLAARGADHAGRRAAPARRAAQGDPRRPRPGGLGRRADPRHPAQGTRRGRDRGRAGAAGARSRVATARTRTRARSAEPAPSTGRGATAGRGAVRPARAGLQPRAWRAGAAAGVASAAARDAAPPRAARARRSGPVRATPRPARGGCSPSPAGRRPAAAAAAVTAPARRRRGRATPPRGRRFRRCSSARARAVQIPYVS